MIPPRRRKRLLRLVAEKYTDGETRAEIGRRYKISTRLVSKMLGEAGAKMTQAERNRIDWARGRKPKPPGRPIEIHLEGRELEDYRVLRSAMGAPYAREVYGLPPGRYATRQQDS